MDAIIYFADMYVFQFYQMALKLWLIKDLLSEDHY